jgi:hypothetical protein
MTERRLPKSTRKYLRGLKARIRRQTADSAEAERTISTLTAEVRAKFPGRMK